MNLPSLLSVVLVAASVSISGAAADLPARRSASSVASVQPPAAAGALRILLVDDDFSDNNHNPGDSRLSPSDRVFRQLVADAVGRDAKAWAIEAVKPYASGPGIERLRPYSLIVWYTGAIYGGNPDNTGVLSLEDEKTVRRYLEEVGGAVILFSPGYLSKALGASGTWEKANWPFVSEVLGIRGGVGLAQRFLPGTVNATGGGQFNVGKGGAGVESQFSLVNPGGASVLFTTVPTDARNFTKATPVATVHAYGRGRIIYVGFTFENLAEADLAPAFQTLLTAAGPQANPTMSVSRPQVQEKRQAAGSDPGPLSVQVSGTHFSTTVSWTLRTGPTVNAPILGPEQTARKAPAGKPPAAPAPAPTVTVQRYEKYSTGADRWENLYVHPGYSQVVDDHRYPAIERRYRLTVTEASGATSVKEVQADVLQIRDPESLTANVQSDGSVILSWPEVPGVTKYQIQTIPGRGSRMVGPVIVNGATEWRSPPLDSTKRYWEVTSLFQPPGGDEFVALTDRNKRPWAETGRPQ